MMIRSNRRLFPLLAAGVLAGVAACDSPVDPVDEHGEPVGAELFDRDSGERLAWTHGTGPGIHWDGGLPVLQPGDELELDVVFLDENGNTIPLDGEFEVRTFFAEGAAQDVIEFDDHIDHVDIDALAPGQTQIYFALYHGNHSDWDSPAITVTVAGEAFDHEPVGVQLFERGTDNLITETHGTGESIHWEDAFPVLAPGEEIEVDVVFLNAAGEVIPLAGEYEVRARFAEGAAEDVVTLENHGDHVDIEAEAAGETMVVFAFWHGDHEDWAPPAIEIVVETP